MTNDTERTRVKQIACICGRTEIEHSHSHMWKCENCGRFHDGEDMDRLAEESRFHRGESA